MKQGMGDGMKEGLKEEESRPEREGGRGILDLHPSELTPGMRQYQEAKRENPDCLIMLRMGDFYEMFYKDAETAARELEITLTARGKGDKRAPLAGVPYHALESYLGKLIQKGYKVAIIEQLEDPKQAKGLVKRGLVRIVTPGTVMEPSLLHDKENNYVMSLTTQGDTFALAFCDLSIGEFFTSKTSSLASVMSEIIRRQPAECILPQSLKVNQEIIEKIQAAGCFLNFLSDHYFSRDRAGKILCEHFSVASVDQFGLNNEHLNIAASGALLYYLLDTQKNSLSHINRITLQSLQQSMVLDGATYRNLELIRTMKDGSSRGSLLQVLDQTVTVLGARLLKKWLKEPLCNITQIEQRLAAVEELANDMILREELRDLLKQIYDLERLVGRVNYGTATPRDVLALQASLRILPMIQLKLRAKLQINLTQSNSTELLQQVAQLESHPVLLNILDEAIREDAPITVREGGIIQPSYNEELAELHDIKSNGKKYLQQIEDSEKIKTGISSLKVKYNNVFGYFIEVTHKNTPLVPATYIRKQTTANAERYITEELKTQEDKILGAQEKIQDLEYQLFQEILETIRKNTNTLQETAQRVAILDVLCSLAAVAVMNNYSRPRFVSEKVIQIRKGRHPVVEKMQERFVANDIMLSNGEMMIITGPNMAGKSTVMRQTALIVLMAQIGSFVPAEECVLGVVDRIFTRVGASDDLSGGQSTFMVEMSETAGILNNATDRSLILLDEIGRGTSTFDGVSIAWSVAEHIYNHIQAKTMFATHYHVLNKLEQKFERVSNYNVAVKEERGDVIFLRKLVRGGTDESYGIHVAKLAGLPDTVVERAREIQDILQKDDEMVRKIKAKKLENQRSLEGF